MGTKKKQPAQKKPAGSAGRPTANQKGVSSGKGKGKKHSKAVMKKLRRQHLQKLAVLAAAIVILIGLFLMLRAVTKALGPEEYDTSTAEFHKNGSIRVTSVESFDQDYYDAAELKKQIKEEISDYNDANGGGVKQNSLEVSNQTAKLVLTYSSAKDYQSFNNTTLFMGTVQEAEDQGFDFASIMSAVSHADSSKILNQDTLDQLTANEVIILTEQVNVVTAQEILYATPNLGVTDSTHATAIDTISADSPAIIILK